MEVAFACSAPGVHLYRLPGSRQEVIAAEQSLHHPDRSVAHLGPDATESKFKSRPLGNFRILHFAVHGLSDPQFPDRGALVLGRDPNSGDDGLPVRRHSRAGGNPFRQITQLSLSADLVTLSACDTAANGSPVYWAPFTLIGDGSAPIIF